MLQLNTLIITFHSLSISFSIASSLVMYRKDLLNFSELAQVEELEKYLKSNPPPDKVTLSSAILKCLDTRDLTESHLETIRLLIQFGADVTVKVPNSSTPLQKACIKGFLDVVKLLLANKAKAEEQDHQERSTIILSLLNRTQDPLEIIKVLCAHGANPALADIKKSTPLHYAALNGHKDSLVYLLSLGVDSNQKNTDNHTALHLASREDHKQCIEILAPVTQKTKSLQGKDENVKSSGNFQKKYPKEDPTRTRGKVKNARGYQGGRKVDRELGSCFNCKQQTEVFCRECAGIYCIDKNEQNDKKGIKEFEECSRVQAMQILKLEKEIVDLKENLGNKSGGYSVRSKLSPLFLRKIKEKSQDMILNCLQADIHGFVRDQERFVANMEYKYSEVVDVFKSLIQTTLPTVQVEVFGSFSTGLLLPYSDIDLVITNTATSPSELLTELLPQIESMPGIGKIDKIFTASIPVIKVNLEHKAEDIKVDITVQEIKHKGVDCRNLIKKFLGTYKTIKQVYLVIKQLIYFCNFHEPYKGGISSYGLFLMVAYFYQENFQNWQFKAYDKESKYAIILTQLLEFYTGRFDYQKPIVVDYEGFDSKEYKNKVVRLR